MQFNVGASPQMDQMQQMGRMKKRNKPQIHTDEHRFRNFAALFFSILFILSILKILLKKSKKSTVYLASLAS